MSVVLSNAVRQNLSSLQATAEMLATTQSRLSSGKKVNTALDNPTNFFTAASLDARASDINNLLDGIGNGVQILQAANTGITSLNKLVDSAKSIANQALQTTSGYATKSNVSTTIAGATSEDLRGTQSFSNATATSNVIFDGTTGGATAASGTDSLGGAIVSIATPAASSVQVAIAADASVSGSALSVGTAAATAAGGTLLSALTSGASATATGPVAGDSITVNGKTITFVTAGAANKDTEGNYTFGLDQTLTSLANTIDTMNNNTTNASVITAGALVLHTGVNSPLTIGDNGNGTLAKLGLVAGTTNTGAGAAANISATTQLFNTNGGLTTSSIADGTTLSVNGKSITFKTADAPSASAMPEGSGVLGKVATDGNGNSTIYLGNQTNFTNATVGDLLTAIDLANGVKSATNANGVATIATNAGQTASTTALGVTTIQSSTGGDLNITGWTDLFKNLGLTTASGSGPLTLTKQRTTSGTTMGTLIADGSTLNVNGKTITFKNAAVPTASASHQGITGNVETDGQGNSTVYLQKGTLDDVLKAVDLATGVQKATLGVSGATVATATGAANSSIASGLLKLSTGLASDLSISGTGNALSALGLTGPSGTATTFTAARGAAAGSLNGKTLTFSSFNGGSAVNLTLGDGTNGTVKSLAQLNVALAANNMSASVDNSTGKLTIATSNDYASHTLGGSDGGVIGGTLASSLVFSIPAAPVADVNAQTTRAGFVKQFNGILDQIKTTAEDASFNGVNLLNGDTLKLVFNETGKSTITIQGVTNNPTGLGLSALTSGTDFIDNTATNAVLAKLSTASTTLRSQASAFGSNLSIVQARQEFSKNLINVLQTGSSNLTLADTNEEAANSQALSTRQSIAVSALSLANTSQQGVLQLLR
uniref:Flagellin n=1 Tax=Rhodopseudomonas palustris (strain BisA53) TaxID=316055 RepID=Q07RG1_RHOP5